jgi:catechol 2,3-dioxygenase-like lactoylglutathione lyase family enzyme
MTTTITTGIGLQRLQHLVLWVSDVERSVRFYRDVLGFEVKSQSPRGAFSESRAKPTTPPRPVRAGGATPNSASPAYHSAGWPRSPTSSELEGPDRGRRAGRLVRSRRQPVALRQGSRRPRVRGLLDGARRQVNADPSAGSRRRAGPPRHPDSLTSGRILLRLRGELRLGAHGHGALGRHGQARPRPSGVGRLRARRARCRRRRTRWAVAYV